MEYQVKEIPGYNGKYTIDTNGVVRNKKDKLKWIFKYNNVKIVLDGKYKTLSVLYFSIFYNLDISKKTMAYLLNGKPVFYSKINKYYSQNSRSLDYDRKKEKNYTNQLSDCYIRKLLTRFNTFEVKDISYELIEAHRKYILLKRERAMFIKKVSQELNITRIKY